MLNTIASYRGPVALARPGRSNLGLTGYGRLNNVHGARLRITTLRAAEGPSVELLEYLAPRDGRPFPADEHANDLIHWQTTLRVSDVEAAARAARAAGGGWVSPGPVQVAEHLGFSRALLARDPDGHVVQLSAP